MDNLLLLIFAVGALTLRAIISLQLYSGYNTPPLFGDFEAQRHWQEITVNLPIVDWYKNTTDNDLLYWGLDYPPLTAYHSWILGRLAKYINESYVELNTSRGITTDEHKLYMRNTVLTADAFLYLPALIIACNTIFNFYSQTNKEEKQITRKLIEALYFIVTLYYPGQILIDNGHFQYNNVSLGFFVAAVWAIMCDRDLLASAFFVFALNYKQMELYHALPFFFYLLAKAFASSDKKSVGFSTKRLGNALTKLTLLGIVVVSLFTLIWLPWLRSLEQMSQVVHRNFPLARGVFEDKVANVWCLVNIFYKIK